ncbi:MAG: cupin domain-containing protein [Pseudomonadota bacterium]
MKSDDLITAHALRPHPFEGYWRETAHQSGQSREGLQLLMATDEAGWHQIRADVTFTLLEGGPIAMSLSGDGKTATGYHLTAPGQSFAIGPDIYRAIACLGAYALVSVSFSPDISISDRDLMPDDWYPKP